MAPRGQGVEGKVKRSGVRRVNVAGTVRRDAEVRQHGDVVAACERLQRRHEPETERSGQPGSRCTVHTLGEIAGRINPRHPDRLFGLLH